MQFTRPALLLLSIGGMFFAPALPAQEAAKVDFERHVLPLFKTHCFDCHGPNQQMNGFRLDRRSDAMRGGTGVMIGPGTSAASRLYFKLVGDRYGPRMPPDRPLTGEEIDTIKRWIDEGAHWPDELAAERPATVADPQATRLMEALRNGERETFDKLLREDASIATRKGPGGSTPLMYAVLYAGVDAVRTLLEKGADPNARNDAGATALMWALDDLEKTRLLIEHGADVNATSDAGRTPVLIASGQGGAPGVLSLLLKHGAKASVVAPSYRGPLTPLRIAAQSGDAAALELLLSHGADAGATGPLPLIAALNSNNAGCVDLLLKSSVPFPPDKALLVISPPFGNEAVLADAAMVERLIGQGADVNARAAGGMTVLMLAASVDRFPAKTFELLLKHGADVKAVADDGKTALDFARLRGDTAIVELLVQAGAKAGAQPAEDKQPLPAPAASPRSAVQRSLPLLQRADATFFQKSGCVSCHHNSLTAMTIGMARRHGLVVDDAIAREQLQGIGRYLDGWRERTLQDSAIPGEVDTVGYLLLGLAAEKYPPDTTTDALARLIKSRQNADGGWRASANRPPLESSPIQVTATAMRALQVYGMQARRGEYEAAIERAAKWLKEARPASTEDRAFQLLGLRWAGADGEATKPLVRDLLAEQRPDGGWGQLATLPSDAYATGQALVALHESGVDASAPEYQAGCRFLMNSQLEDGSWHVRSRALAFQPYFESGFPHGHDQWISAAATNWSAMALIPAAK